MLHHHKTYETKIADIFSHYYININAQWKHLAVHFQYQFAIQNKESTNNHDSFGNIILKTEIPNDHFSLKRLTIFSRRFAITLQGLELSLRININMNRDKTEVSLNSLVNTNMKLDTLCELNTRSMHLPTDLFKHLSSLFRCFHCN